MRSNLLFFFILLFMQLGYCFAQTQAQPISPTSASNQSVEALAKTCVACHGEKGVSVNPLWPNLAGQNPKYFIEQMIAFKLGPKDGRNNPIMHGIAAGLKDEDFKNLANYFYKLPPHYSEAQPSNLELGQKIYKGGLIHKGVPACSACHNPHGRGNEAAGFPTLAGQHAEYTVLQLQNYKNGQRTNGINGIMVGIAAKMSDAEMQAVANYIQGLQ